MIKAMFFMIKVGILVTISVWVANRPGEIKIEWLDYSLKINVGIFLLILLVIILLSIFFYRVIRTFVDFPKSYSRYREIKRRDKGYRALTLGLTAVAAGDTKTAIYQASRATTLLPNDTGLPLLLKAQSARMDGRENDANKSFAAMLENKDASFLGVRGMLQASLDTGNNAAALELAYKALKIHPKQPWILRIVYNMEINMREWGKAYKTLSKAEKSGSITAEQAGSDRIAILLAEADEGLKQGFLELSMQKLQKAYKYDRNFIPTIMRIVQLQIQNGQRGKAIKLVKKAWKFSSNRELAELWDTLFKPDKSSDPMTRLLWFEKLRDIRPENAEGHIAVGRAAIEAGLWGEARGHFKKAEARQPCPRLYNIMSELETLGPNDEEAAQKWLKKAAEAPPEKEWICKETGRIYSKWSPIAEPHGSFNTIIFDYPDGALTRRL